MKRTLFFALTLSALIFSWNAAEAQPKCDGNWKEKMMTEKIAFLTVELDLTPEEAQVFWPVYNQIHQEFDKATGEVIKAHKDLAEALDGGKSKKVISEKLDIYMAAKRKQQETTEDSHMKYMAVLPVEKVAKLYISEEKFRRQHIRRLHNKPEERK